MAKALTAPTKKPIRLAPVRPNQGVAAAYQKRLNALVDQMNRSVVRAIMATYRRNPPEMAMDDSAPADLQATINRLSAEWEDRFDDFAQSIGTKFSRDAIGSADRSFAAGLKRAGFTVEWRTTAAVNEVLRSAIAENVALVKSIPQQYLLQVQGHTMRAAQVGRDAGTLAEELASQFGVTKRRAATISRDQTNKSTSAIVRTRQAEIGVTQAVWIHPADERTPRPEHVKADGQVYDIARGLFLEGRWTFPGYEINCHCVSRSIIPGLD